MMTKQQIIAEIKRIAGQNSSKAPGIRQFERETQIKRSAWYPHLWLRWGDALKEAGYKSNTLDIAYKKDDLILHYIKLIRELKHFPISGELQRKRKEDPNYPSHNAFIQLGNKVERANIVLEYCKTHEGYDDIISICEDIVSQDLKSAYDDSITNNNVGYVYLIRHGNRNEYKIGMTNNPIRREGEIRMQLPDKVKPIHTITTDDPSGIEQYWHKRFASKRKEGEWFELTKEDVKAFKRWKHIN